MGRVKEWLIEEEQHKAEMRLLEEEKQFEISKIMDGMPGTLNDCHEKIITLAERNRDLATQVLSLMDQVTAMRSWPETIKNQCVGFFFGVAASLVAALIIWLFSPK